MSSFPKDVTEISDENLEELRDKYWNMIEDKNTDVMPLVSALLEIEEERTIRRYTC